MKYNGQIFISVQKFDAQFVFHARMVNASLFCLFMQVKSVCLSVSSSAVSLAVCLCVCLLSDNSAN